MNKFYCVRKGRVQGIYNSWDKCKKEVDGFKGAEFKSFLNLREAEEYMNNIVINTNNVININNINNTNNKCIYVDGGHNKMSGNVAFASVVNGNGEDLIPQYINLFDDIELMEVNLPVGIRTIGIAKFGGLKKEHNGAELLAMIMGLRIAINTNNYDIIYSDSQLIVDYWSLGKYNKLNLSDEKIKYINELIELRKIFIGSIIKISGDNNLADLGYH